MEEEAEASSRRLSQVSSIDVLSMLNSLRELEHKLLEHHKLDIDLASILPRLEHLEKEWKSQAMLPHASRAKGEDSQQNPHSSSNEHEFFERVQKSIDFMSEKHQLTLESKLSSVSLELDRVHKLLATRPTTSDLSKIMLSVQDMNVNLMKTINENASYVQSAIKDKVAEEMGVVIENIKSSGELSLKGVDGLLKQIDGISSELIKTKTSLNSEIKGVAYTVGLFRERLDELAMKQAAIKNEIASQQHDTWLPPFKELKSDFLGRFDHLYSELEAARQKQLDTEARLETQGLDFVNRIDGVDLRLEQRISERESAYKQLEQQVALNEELLGSRIGGVRGEVEELSERINAYMGLLQQLKTADVVKTMNRYMTQLNELEHHRSQVNDLNASVLGRLRQVETSLGKVEKEAEKIPGDIQALENANKNQLEAAIKTMEAEMQAKLDNIVTMINVRDVELADSKEMVNSLSSEVLSLDQRLKLTKKEQSGIQEKVEDFQSVVYASLRGVEAQQQKNLVAIDEIAPKIDLLGSKLRSVTSSLEKTEEDMSRLNQRFNEEDNKKRAAKVFGQVRQASFRKPRRSIEGGVAKSSPMKFRIQPKSFDELRSEQFDPMTRPLSVKMKKVEITTADEDEFAQTGTASSPMSPDSRRQDTYAAPSAPNDDMYFDELPDFEDDLEEIKEEILSQAEYTAELCVSYEEQSLKHSRLLELPKAMCEHMVQTAQALAAFASNAADAEVVLRVLRASPNDLSYDESTVNAIREEKLETFLSDVISAIEKMSTREPGVIRAEARELFLKKLRTALVLCMSKHDQVHSFTK